MASCEHQYGKVTLTLLNGACLQCEKCGKVRPLKTRYSLLILLICLAVYLLRFVLPRWTQNEILYSLIFILAAIGTFYLLEFLVYRLLRKRQEDHRIFRYFTQG